MKIIAAHERRLTAYHGLAIAEGVVGCAVELADRYLAEVGSPRAPLELLDHAMARMRLSGGRMVDVDAVIAALSEMTGINEERLR